MTVTWRISSNELPIQCLRPFHLLFLLSYYCCCCCSNCYKTIVITVTVTVAATTAIQTIILLCYWSLCCRYLSPGVVKLTTQLLILLSILWLPLCRIYKFVLNTLPSKTVAIPYTCGLSGGGGHKPTLPCALQVIVCHMKVVHSVFEHHNNLSIHTFGPQAGLFVLWP